MSPIEGMKVSPDAYIWFIRTHILLVAMGFTTWGIYYYYGSPKLDIHLSHDFVVSAINWIIILNCTIISAMMITKDILKSLVLPEKSYTYERRTVYRTCGCNKSERLI